VSRAARRYARNDFRDFFAFLCPAWSHRCSLPYDSCRPSRIAKRYVCAVKSFRALMIVLLTRHPESPNATCVRPTRFLPSCLGAARRSVPVTSRQTLRTYCLLRFHFDFTKRYTRTCFGAFCLAICTSLDLSGRQTCAGVVFARRRFLQRAFISCAVSQNVSKRQLKQPLGSRRTPNVRTRTVCARVPETTESRFTTHQ
jgi:hypothetical protein